MRLDEFDYELPKNLIAQKGASPRDRSRLLVLERPSGKIEHRHFYDLPDYLRPGDVLVLNNSKVMPARLQGTKPTGGRLEVFLLKAVNDNIWQCLLGGKRRQTGLKLKFGSRLTGEIASRNNDGTWQIRFNLRGSALKKEIEKIGQVPLPPYIKRTKVGPADKVRYQTIYADDKRSGSVAAPTAGLHFTPALIKKLQKRGVQVEFVTLHVGLGTFAPVKTEKIEEHRMHDEWFEVSKNTLQKIIKAKKEGRRIIAVGTTSARVLETLFQNSKFKIKNYSGATDIFIYPGFKFKAVDALLTNFHLPKSTLLMLVSAFTTSKNDKDSGLKLIKKAYQEAVRKKYRFFSYGDAMLIR